MVVKVALLSELAELPPPPDEHAAMTDADARVVSVIDANLSLRFFTLRHLLGSARELQLVPTGA
jgi:hypothetical protein